MARSFLQGGASLVLATPRSSPLAGLEGAPGVLALYTGGDLPAEGLAAALLGASGACVVLIDDAELLRDCSAADVLRDVLRAGPERSQGLVLAGNADDLCTGFSGWQVDATRSRQGALLSPQGASDGDLIGVRLPRSQVRAAIAPGRALLHLGDSELHAVAVPLSTAAEIVADTRRAAPPRGSRSPSGDQAVSDLRLSP
jgi:DNA segregation ATPase FtsK/SpoIIIE, S-DNA-T family